MPLAIVTRVIYQARGGRDGDRRESPSRCFPREHSVTLDNQFVRETVLTMPSARLEL